MGMTGFGGPTEAIPVSAVITTRDTRRAKRRSVLRHLPKAGVHQACTASRWYLLKPMMIDALEKRLIEALKSVDAHGDVAPAHVMIR